MGSYLDMHVAKYIKFQPLNVPLLEGFDFYKEASYKKMDVVPPPCLWEPCLPNQLIGVEVEVEKARGHRVSDYIPAQWVGVTTDGSLRNDGFEFITCPHTAEVTEEVLSWLMDCLPPKCEFGPRTSTHVHINIRTLTLGQLASFLYTYLVFEKLLYKWVGRGREENIFCVPLYQTTLPHSIHSILSNGEAIRWTKYCGFNLTPYSTKGTVEFRHLYGTRDVKTILTWIQFILRMLKYSMKSPNEYILPRILQLNTNSEYRMFLEEVFEEDACTWFDDPDLSSFMEHGISYLKSMAFNNTFLAYLTNNLSNTSELMKRLGRAPERKPQRPKMLLDWPSADPEGAPDSPLPVHD